MKRAVRIADREVLSGAEYHRAAPGRATFASFRT
jgi:hypothetical protein